MLCEMCGEEVESTSRVRVEGSVLRLCSECARFGTVLDPPAVPATVNVPGRPMRTPRVAPVRSASQRGEERDLFSEMPELELAADWPKRIRGAREARQWTPEDLGKRLNEKKSVVLKLESGSFRPPDALVRKLEHMLGVRLRAEPAPAP